MKNFVDLLKEKSNLTETSNGAIVNKSTLNGVVDWFASMGSMRNHEEKEINDLLSNAISEDRELAIKSIFFLRDCRGGMGEKETFFKAMKYIELYDDKKVIEENLHLIPEYGSWKDLITLYFRSSDLKIRNKIIHVLYERILEDCEIMYDKNKANISLLGKWLPTINSKSTNTKSKAKEISGRLNKLFHENGYQFDYRRYCVDARKELKIVEKDIAQKTYSNIDYEKVPSRCMLLNKDLFERKDEERFVEYISNVESGNKKINSSVLFPSDIVKRYNNTNLRQVDTVLEQMWNALPNYMTKGANIIPVIDTSGSMTGTPMDVAVALGIYMSERNPSEIYRNKVLEFSYNVKFYDMSNKKTLLDKINGFCYEVQNTDIEKVFNTILETAIEHNLKQEDLPESLLIISDMEFDSASYTSESKRIQLMEFIRGKYQAYEYELPSIIYWNVNSSLKFPEVSKDGIVYISGYSPSLMKTVLSLKVFNPIEMVRNSVLVDRYSDIYF